MAKRTNADRPDVPSPDDAEPAISFEEALSALEQIVHDLEEGQLGLDEALGRYEAGVKLLRRCYGMLEGAQRRIELLTGMDADGNPIVKTFDGQAAQSLEEKAQSRSRRRTSVEGCSPPGGPTKPNLGSQIDTPGGGE
jgi:exodeoxyribonuclease VII small subunit